MKIKTARKQSMLKTRRDRIGYLYVAPFALGFILFILFPMVQSLIYSFNTLSFDGKVNLSFSGLDNFKRALFEDVEYREMLLEAVGNMSLSVPVILIFSLIVAVFLNNKFPGKSVFQIIFFIPVILSSGVLPGLMEGDLVRSTIINASSAAGDSAVTFDTSNMSAILIGLNIPETVVKYLMYAITNILEIINSSGIQILVFTMALKSIPGQLYEAAYVEGATPWESFWKITLPMILPQFMVNVVYTVIDAFVNNSNTVMQSINSYNFSKFDFGYAAGLAWMYFAIILLVLAAFVGILRLLSRNYR